MAHGQYEGYFHFSSISGQERISHFSSICHINLDYPFLGKGLWGMEMTHESLQYCEKSSAPLSCLSTVWTGVFAWKSWSWTWSPIPVISSYVFSQVPVFKLVVSTFVMVPRFYTKHIASWFCHFISVILSANCMYLRKCCMYFTQA